MFNAFWQIISVQHGERKYMVDIDNYNATTEIENKTLTVQCRGFSVI